MSSALAALVTAKHKTSKAATPPLPSKALAAAEAGDQPIHLRVRGHAWQGHPSARPVCDTPIVVAIVERNSEARRGSIR